jgi:mannose-1-phosphate guanylyltransferase
MSLKAMIFAAGFGTRMGPLSELLAKPAMPFYGRPLIAHTLDWLAKSGVTTAVVNLHHNPRSVREAVKQHLPPGMKVSFSAEDDILGTGGGLKAAESHFTEEPFFLVVNGDVFTQFNLEIPLRIHQSASPLSTLVLTDNPDHRELFGVGINVAREITDFWGEPQNSNAFRHCAFTGIHIVNPDLLKILPEVGYACIKEDAYLPALRAEKKLMSAVMKGNWFDLGTPQRYLDAHVQMLNQAEQLCAFPERSPGVISADPLPEQLEVEAPVVVGPGLKASAGASIGPCAFLGSNVSLGKRSRLSHVVVWDGAKIKGSISHAVVAPGGVIVSTQTD